MRPAPLLRVALAAATAVLSVTSATAHAASSPYAPLGRPGPRLSVPLPDLRAALHCEGDARKGPEPVLLSPGTSATAKQNFSWNYERAFTAQHRAFCDVSPPHHTLGDIQVAGEYLVYSIRALHARAGRRVAVLGHSQGGMSMRWALRFWPDTRPMVDDIIGMAPTNHGTTAAGGTCQPGVTSCVPASWQQSDKALFIQALNSRTETFAGISYTNVFTHADEEVRPSDTAATASSSLHTGRGLITNVATQDVCPMDSYEHNLTGTVDPVTYALVMDALDHPGPAKPSRVPASVCQQVYQPGIDPANPDDYLQPAQLAPAIVSILVPDANLVGAPETAQEPPLRCYVFAKPCPTRR